VKLLLLAAALWTCGGTVAGTARELIARGTEYSEGLHGPFRLAIDLRTGAYKLVAQTGPNARGILNDGSLEWHRDASGGVHPEDSPAARAIAAAHATLARCLVVARKKTTVPGYYWSEIVQFADYRKVSGLRLPYRITSRRSGRTNETVDIIQAYEVLDRSNRSDFAAFSPPHNQGTHGNVTATVPLTIEGEAPIVPVMIDGKGPYRFFVDTAGHNLLFADAAADLGLKLVGTARSGGSGAGTVDQQYATLGLTTVGSAWMAHMPFAVLGVSGKDVAASLAPSAEPIAGILGLETFERFAVRVDYDAKSVSLTPLRDFRYAGIGTSLPILFENDAPTVEATVDGILGRFMVDTGDVGEMILFAPFLRTSELARRYGSGDAGHGMGMGGETTFTSRVVGALRIGPYAFRSVGSAFSQQQSGSFSSSSEAGLFGSDILSRFNLTFDYARGIIYWEKREK
jgi:aspartyl protease